jgi:hypothetical protein
MAGKRRPYTCSFCGKNQEQTSRLIAGPNSVYICADCIALCNEILAQDERSMPSEHSVVAQASAQPSASAWWRRLVARRYVPRRRQTVQRQTVQRLVPTLG